MIRNPATSPLERELLQIVRGCEALVERCRALQAECIITALMIELEQLDV